MSSECAPTVTGDSGLATAIRESLGDATFTHDYPKPGELTLVVALPAAHANPLGATETWSTASACVEAKLTDAFGTFELPSRCSGGKGNGSAGAIARADAARAAEAAITVHTIAVAARTRLDGLMTCRITAAAPFSQLKIVRKGSDAGAGPFAGTAVDLACLPKQNLLLHYQIDGAPADYEVSPAMCSAGVQLPVKAKQPALDAGVGSGSGTGSDNGQHHGGNGMMTQQMWFAGITGVVFLGAMLFIFGRNAFNPNPLNPAVERFLRILIALFGAAFGAILTGFLTVDIKTGGLAVNAGAGLALGVILYFFDPPSRART